MESDVTSGQCAAVMLGLPGFAVLSAGEAAGELELLVETAARRTGCPRCGVVAVPHGRREHLVRDVPAHGRPVLLVWSKRIWRCAGPHCAKRTWTETSQAVAPRSALTERARRWACQRVGRDEQTVAAVARELGVGWATVMRAVRDHGQPLIDDPARLEGVTGLGVDEHVWQHASARRFTQFATGITEGDPLYGARRLLRRRAGRLNHKAAIRLQAALTAGDPHGEVTAAWICAQDLARVYLAPDPAEGRRRALDVIGALLSCPVPEARRLGRTLRSWQKEFLAYHATSGASNGPTEAVNLIVEKTRRLGHGFRNWDNYRLRLLLRCGGIHWDTVVTPRVRSRRSRLVA